MEIIKSEVTQEICEPGKDMSRKSTGIFQFTSPPPHEYIFLAFNVPVRYNKCYLDGKIILKGTLRQNDMEVHTGYFHPVILRPEKFEHRKYGVDLSYFLCHVLEPNRETVITCDLRFELKRDREVFNLPLCDMHLIFLQDRLKRADILSWKHENTIQDILTVFAAKKLAGKAEKEE